MYDPGPYQSRLLNLLVPQYRRLVEKGDRAIRQMKVAASWAAQVVIYPVYLLLQTTRVAFRQLGQTVKAQLPQLKARVEAEDEGGADRPISQVLLAVLLEAEELVLTPEVVRPQSLKPNVPQHRDLIVNNTSLVSPKQQDMADRLPPATPQPVDPRGGYKGQVIRGLATELTSKNLVLVTADNQELDILTSSQQKKIKQLIILQLAKYWRQQRQQGLSKRPLTWGKLAQSKTIILPIRLLGQVMMWEQKGTVTRTIDLFGESSLVDQPRTEPAQTEPAQAEQEAIASWSKLDSFIAALEGQISIIWEGPTQIERQTREITESPSQTESVTDGSEREKQNILAILGAAITYFFGSQGKDLGAENSVEVKQLTHSSYRQSEKKEIGPVSAAGGSERLAAEGLWGWQAIKNQVRCLPGSANMMSPGFRRGSGGHQAPGRHRGRLRNDRQLLGLNQQEVAALIGNQIELEGSSVQALGNSHSEEVTDGRTLEKQNILALIKAEIADFLGNKGGDQNLPGSASEKVQQLTESQESGEEGPSRDKRLTGAEKGLTPILGKSPKNQILGYLGRPDQAEAQPQTGSLEVQSGSQVEPEDWVTWIDIFGSPAGRGEKLKPTPGQAAQNRPKDYQRKQAIPKAGAAKAEEVGTLVGTTVSGRTLDQQAPGDNRYIQLTPDWIETPATPSGYVKHPLEKILEWLDRGILWLEDRAIGIWKWFVRE